MPRAGFCRWESDAPWSFDLSHRLPFPLAGESTFPAFSIVYDSSDSTALVPRRFPRIGGLPRPGIVSSPSLVLSTQGGYTSGKLPLLFDTLPDSYTHRL